MTSSIDVQEVETMRTLGASFQHFGFLEINLVTGHYSWANDFILGKYGLTLNQIQSMTVFDLVPEMFHDDARNMISDHTNGRLHKFSIWPGKSVNNKIIWLYSHKVKAQHPLYWFRTEYLSSTGDFGPEFSSMHAIMNTTNNYNELYHKLLELQGWTQENINRLGQESADIRNSIDSIKDQMRSCLAAANKAANVALENAHTINSFKTDISRELSNHTAEILMLISTDTMHDKRMQIFEGYMKETTTKAITAIQDQAEKSGKGLARKVTIPVGAIAAIATLIQWFIQNWPRSLHW